MEYDIISLTKKEFIPHLKEFQMNIRKKKDNFNLSQYWLPDLSDDAYAYAIHRKFINVATIRGEFVGFIIAFSPVIKFIEQKTSKIIDMVSQSLDNHQSALYVSSCISRCNNDGEIFGNLIAELFMKVHASNYFSQVVMLEQKNLRLHAELIKMEFDLVDSVSLNLNSLPETNVFSYSIGF